jgi:hypothetical protein
MRDVGAASTSSTCQRSTGSPLDTPPRSRAYDFREGNVEFIERADGIDTSPRPVAWSSA